jgi:hypothetical protein
MTKGVRFDIETPSHGWATIRLTTEAIREPEPGQRSGEGLA